VVDYLAAGAPDGVRMITELSSALSYNVIGGLTVAVLVVPFAVALRKPRAWARIGAVVGIGIHLVAQVVFFGANPTYYAEPDRRASAAARPLWDNLVPDWYGPSQQILQVVVLLVSIAAAAFFFVRGATDYFVDGYRDAADSGSGTSRDADVIGRPDGPADRSPLHPGGGVRGTDRLGLR
jgi:hypothetical protein